MSRRYLTASVGGGLGNQLFQIAATFRIKQDVPDDDIMIVFPSIDNEVRPKAWNNFLADCPQIQELLVSELPKVNWEILGNLDTCFVYHDFVSEVIQQRSKSIKINNYFQNIQFLPEKPFLLKLFNIKEKQNSLREKTQFATEKSCSLHFRLGDYKALPHYHTNLGDDYYKKALAKLDLQSGKIKRIYIFNEREDQAQVESRVSSFGISSEIEILYVTKTFSLKEDWESMILMSLCEFNIIANSTFSWWGAYFNKFFNVICPDAIKTPWVRSRDIEHFNLYFPGWTIIV